MTDSIIKKINYIFVLFSHGLGGNHLTNLISLAFNFDQIRFENNKQNLLNYYENNDTVHLKTNNLQGSFLSQKLKQKPPVILNGHLGEYLAKKNFFNSFCKNKKFVVLNYDASEPEIYSKICTRLDKLEYSYHKDFGILGEQHYLYANYNLSKLIECPYEDFITIDLKIFYQDDVTKFLEPLSLYFETSIFDIDLCKKIHRIWLEKNNLL